MSRSLSQGTPTTHGAISGAQSLSVVVYCYNVATGIEELLTHWLSVLEENVGEFELIACNAGSSDGTGRVLDSLRRRYPRLRVLHQLRIGRMRSYRRGIESARGAYVAQLDGNKVYEISDLMRMWEYRQRFHAVLAYRSHRIDSLIRRLFHYALRRSIRFLFSLDIRDPNIGFRLIRRKFLLSLLKECPANWESDDILVSILAFLQLPQAIQQIPVPFRCVPKEDRLSLARLFGCGFQTFAVLLRLRWRHRKTLSASLAGSRTVSA